MLNTYFSFCGYWMCFSITAFTSLSAILVDITRSVVAWKTCAITAAIKKYNSIIIKKRRNMIK